MILLDTARRANETVLSIWFHYGTILTRRRIAADEIAAPMDDFYDAVNRFRLVLLFSIPVLVVVARKVVTPVAEIAREHELSKRLPIFRTGDELQSLSETLNEMFGRLPTPESMDGVYFDATRKRIYVSGGRDLRVGFAYVYRLRDADHYDTIGKVPRCDGAGTSFWSPELDRYDVAAEATDKEQAAILVYAPQD
jgi:HAMP domain